MEMYINPSIYNILRWVAWTMGQMNRRPSVNVPSIIFFHDFLQNSLQKSFQFIFLFFYKIKKMILRSFECPNSIKSTWNILVKDSFVPLSKQPSVIYCRLTDFWSGRHNEELASQSMLFWCSFGAKMCILFR